MKTKTFQFENGDAVREKITGFSGIITGTAFYLTGCTQYLITAESKNEITPAKASWYDEGRVELVKIEGNPSVIEIKNEVGAYDEDENGPDMAAPGGERGY